MNQRKRISIILTMILLLQIFLPMVATTKILAIQEANQEEQVVNDIEASVEINENVAISEEYKSSVITNGNNGYILEDKEEESEYSQEYLEWSKLTDTEKKNTLEPRKEYVPFDSLYDGSDEYINEDTTAKQETVSNTFITMFKSDNNEDETPSTYSLTQDLGDILAELQSPYNTCYAYPALNAIETNIELTTGKEYDFSEMHIEYMTSTLLGGSRELDSGGNFETAMNYSFAGKGPVLESDIPKKDYTEDEYDDLRNATAIAKVNSYKNFPTMDKKNNSYSSNELNEFRDVVKKHIMNYGAVFAGLYYCIDENEADYYNPTTYAYACLDKNTTMNHAITIVGWNDNYSKDNFPAANRPSSDGAYIAINSWGDSWGDNGYFYISYEDIWVENQMSGVLSVDLLEPTIEFSNYTDTGSSISVKVTVEDEGKSGINANSLKYVWLENGQEPNESDFVNTFSNGDTISINTNDNLNLWILVENNKGIKAIGKAVTFSGGNGSTENPYLIETPEQLDAIRNNLSANYKLLNNIDLEYDTQNKSGKFYNNGDGWKQINNFYGILDGNGYSILNLSGSSSKDFHGLFRVLEGIVKNIGIYNLDIDAYSYVGGVAGLNNGTIENTYVSGSIEGHENIGGIAGTNEGIIQNCYNTANVVGQYNIGGISGENSSNGQIANVYNVGHIGADLNDTVANVVGINSGNVQNTYYINEILNGVGQDTGSLVNVTKVTENDMKNISTFSNFDFNNIWEINESGNYKFPTLKAVAHIEKEENTQDFAGGNGTLYNPYLISTPSHLNNVRNDLYACYKLTNNIDLEYDTQNENGLFYNNGEGWKPLSTSYTDCTLMGVFDGNGYSILNLYINRDEQNQGLFGNSRGLIQNFGLVNINVKGETYTGGISAVNYFIIQNVYTTGIIEGVSITGFITNSNYGLIKNAYNTGYSQGGGGIAGSSSSDTSIIENVYNVGRTGIAIFGDSLRSDIYIHAAILAIDSANYIGGNPEYRLKNAYYLDDSMKTGGAIKDKSNSVYFPDEEEEETVYEFENVEMLTLEQFKEQNSFIGFDFENEWEMPEEGSYSFPILKNVPHIEKEENTTDFAGGNGTYYNPYLISTPSHLNNIRNDLYACYKLTNDIDLKYDTQDENGMFYNQGKGWQPIGNKDTGFFKGILDGNSYRVLNMKINDPDLYSAGLFGKMQRAIITDLKMTYSYVYGRTQVGNLAGAMNSSIISNIGCSGDIIGSVAGGIAGDSGSVIIKECFNSSNVYGYNNFGYGQSSSGGITNSEYEYGELNISDSYNIGSIKLLNDGYAGGILGKLDSPISCTNIYNAGDIDNNATYAGNIIGWSAPNGGISNVFYLDNELEAVGNREELTQEEYVKTIEQMKMQSTFSEFDFENTWEIQENKFPVLKGSNHVYLTDINADNINVEVGEERTVELSFVPEIADNAVFKYSIGNNEIVSISNNGTVKGLKEGKTTINVQTIDGSISKTINVQVGKAKVLTGIEIKTAPIVTTYFLGESLNTEGLVLTATYEDGTEEEITEGFICTPTTLNTIGEQTITVTYEDKTATYNVTVVLKGDANGDNQVNFRDILVINNHRLGKTQLTGIYLEAADVNEDGKIDFMDILQVNRYRLGKIDSL